MDWLNTASEILFGSNDNDKEKSICPCCDENVKISYIIKERLKLRRKKEWTCPHCKFNIHWDYEDRNAFSFLVVSFSMLIKMAEADGEVCQEEKNVLVNIFKETSPYLEEKEAIELINGIYKKATKDNTTIYEYAKQLSELLLELINNNEELDNEELDEEELEEGLDRVNKELYQMLWDVATADGIINENEDRILKNITDILEIHLSWYFKNKMKFQDKKSLQIYEIAYISMLAKMAKADGVICEKEINVITNLINEMKLGSKRKEKAHIIFNKAKTDNTSIYEHAQQFSDYFNYSSKQVDGNITCVYIYQNLWDVATADGIINENEDKILKNITYSLGIPEELYFECKSSTQSTSSVDIAECYKILGCTENDTDQIVKQKYKKAIAEFHPDKIESKDLNKDFINFANEQSQKIILAFETIQKYRENT